MNTNQARRIAAGFEASPLSPLGIFATTGEVTERMAYCARERLQCEYRNHRVPADHPLRPVYEFLVDLEDSTPTDKGEES